MYNGNGGENLYIDNLIRIHKENGKEMKELKNDAKKCCSDEFKLLKLLNKIVNANQDKKTMKKRLKLFLILPSSPNEIFLPPDVINRTREYIFKDLGRKEYLGMRWRIEDAERDCDAMKNP